MRSSLGETRPRDLAFDVLKGIGIAEVLTHHTLNFSARKYSTPGTFEWWAMWELNRLLHFAIPTFLLCSALLLARSLAKRDRPDYRTYAKRRLVRTVGPYVVWTFLFLIWRAYFMKVGSDTHPYTLHLPWGASITGPDILLDPNELRHYLMWGKASFHLYFLSVLIQITLILPLVVAMLRRVRLGFGAIVLIAAALQIGAFLLQSFVIRSPHPASLFTWYLPSILLGSWLGMHWGEWDALWVRNRKWLLAAAVIGVIPYLILATLNQKNVPVSTLGLNCALGLYGTAMAILLLGWAGQWQPTRAVRFLAGLGALSLPLFILHPIILFKLGGPKISPILAAIPGSPIWTLLLLGALTVAAAKILIWLRLDGILFGRRYAKEPKVAGASATRPEPVPS